MKRLVLALSIALGALAALAPGAVAETITVNSTADDASDDGECTLREAIMATNGNSPSGAMGGECAGGDPDPTVDEIVFSAAFNGEVADTIEPTVITPTVLEELEIDGGDCGTAGQPKPCVGLNLIDGIADNNLISGITAGSSVNLTVRGLAISGARFGVGQTDGTGSMTVTNNWFGLKLDGTVASNEVGALVGSNSTIGGTADPSTRNVFAAHTSDNAGERGAGIWIHGGDNNNIWGNYFSTAANGVPAAGTQNDDNIRIVDDTSGPDQATGNIVGNADGGTPGVCDGACNLLVNAEGQAINLNGIGGPEAPMSGEVIVRGNFMGLGLDGTTLEENGDNVMSWGAGDITLGGSDVADRNYINGDDGFVVFSFANLPATSEVQNNFFGLNAAGTARVPATVPDTMQSLQIVDDGAIVRDNRFGGAPVVLTGPNQDFFGNVVGVGTGGQDVGIDGYAVLVGGDFVDLGGGTPGEGNVVGFQTGAQFAAIGVLGGAIEAQDVAIMGNHIGTDAGGGFYPNEGAGIEVGIPTGDAASGAVIGGCPACANVISNSGTDAIRIENDGSDENHVSYNTGRNNGRLDVFGPTNDLFLDLGPNGEGNSADGPNAGIEAPGIGNGLTLSAATTTRLNGTSSAPDGTNVHVYTTYTRYADVKSFVADGVVNGGAWTVTYPSALPAGTCITAAQVDGDNNTSELAPPVAVSGNGGLCDRIRPRTRITRVRKRIGPGGGGILKLRFKSNEKAAKFECSRQRTKFRRCRSPKTFRRLVSGECSRVRVRAVDAAGNRDRSPAKVRFCVPNSRP